MVDAVLAETGRTQQRLRILPSRVVVYLLLAAGLFAEVGYLGVWDKLVAGLDALRLTRPSGTAVWQARIRVGVKPLRALFDLLRGPAAGIRTAGVWWCLGMAATSRRGARVRGTSARLMTDQRQPPRRPARVSPHPEGGRELLIG